MFYIGSPARQHARWPPQEACGGGIGNLISLFAFLLILVISLSLYLSLSLSIYIYTHTAT